MVKANSVKVAKLRRAMEKRSNLALGPAGHFVANALVKATHGTSLARNIRARRMSRGILRGISGEPQSFLSRATEMWGAPEVFANEHLGKTIGEQLSYLPKHRIRRQLKSLRKMFAQIPELQHAPVTEDIVGGINRALEKKITKVGPSLPETLGEQLSPALLAPIIAAGDPSALIHGAGNVLRKITARSGTGQQFMEASMKKGLLGNTRGKFKRGLYDFLLSPAALDPERLGTQISLAAIRDPFKMNRLKAMLDNIASKGGGTDSPLINNLRNQLNAALNKAKEQMIQPLGSTPTERLLAKKHKMMTTMINSGVISRPKPSQLSFINTPVEHMQMAHRPAEVINDLTRPMRLKNNPVRAELNKQLKGMENTVLTAVGKIPPGNVSPMRARFIRKGVLQAPPVPASPNMGMQTNTPQQIQQAADLMRQRVQKVKPMPLPG